MEKGTEFDMFNRVEMVALTTKCGFKWLDVTKGNNILEHGKEVERLLFATHGKIKITDGSGNFIAILDIDEVGCQWLGEMSYYTGDAASASLVAESENVRLMSWSMHKMRHLSHSHSHSVESVVFRQLPSLFASQLAGRTKRLSQDLAVGRKDSARMAKALANTKVTPVSGGTKRTKSKLRKKSTMKQRLEASASHHGTHESDVDRAMEILDEVEEMSALNKNKWKLAKHKTIQEKVVTGSNSTEDDLLVNFHCNTNTKTWS